jgi:hypothetical protein
MDIINSKLKIEFMPVAIIGYVYSFFISLFYLNYYRNKKYTNCFLFLLNVLHLSLIFCMPIIAYVTLTNEEALKPIKESKMCFLAIKIINMTNHVLNKLFYPLVVVYYQSGYMSIKNIFTHITFSDIFWELYAYPFIIIILIIYFPLKEEIMSVYQNDELLYFLNYLNILDLILTYFEIGFSCGSLLRYFYSVFTRVKEYQQFILGKLYLYEKDIKKEFTRRFTKFMILSNLYSGDIHKYKLNDVNKFINDVNTQKYFDRNLYPEQMPKVENIKKVDLEKVLSKYYGLSKSLLRRIRRIETVREDKINSIKNIEKKRCCSCIYKCCIASFCQRLKCIIFSLVCIAILVCETFYFIQNKNDVIDTIYNKTKTYSNFEYPLNDPIIFINNTISNSTNNNTDTNVGIQLGMLVLIYPLYLITIFVTCGIYIIPIFYGITQRNFITGEFMYERGGSDSLEMIKSVRKLSTKMFSALYLSSLFYITFVLRESFPINSKGEQFEFLKFFEVPLSAVVLGLRYFFIIFVMILTRLVESINCKCFVMNICDECYFEPRPCEPCFKGCVERKRNKYIEAGKSEASRLLSYENIKASNEQELLV